ncbi:hypothetical protein ACJX0J_033433 [Zea mays]
MSSPHVVILGLIDHLLRVLLLSILAWHRFYQSRWLALKAFGSGIWDEIRLDLSDINIIKGTEDYIDGKCFVNFTSEMIMTWNFNNRVFSSYPMIWYVLITICPLFCCRELDIMDVLYLFVVEVIVTVIRYHGEVCYLLLHKKKIVMLMKRSLVIEENTPEGIHVLVDLLGGYNVVKGIIGLHVCILTGGSQLTSSTFIFELEQ